MDGIPAQLLDGIPLRHRVRLVEGPLHIPSLRGTWLQTAGDYASLRSRVHVLRVFWPRRRGHDGCTRPAEDVPRILRALLDALCHACLERLRGPSGGARGLRRCHGASLLGLRGLASSRACTALRGRRSRSSICRADSGQRVGGGGGRRRGTRRRAAGRLWRATGAGGSAAPALRLGGRPVARERRLQPAGPPCSHACSDGHDELDSGARGPAAVPLRGLHACFRLPVDALPAARRPACAARADLLVVHAVHDARRAAVLRAVQATVGTHFRHCCELPRHAVPY
mmetsp:Transcript_104784/g.291816  ORF Transcript_104784/g.291816 Transcript_104784/m.291816 type:complete len:284 (-) Transcript_104784:418-1269(-)